MRADRFICEIYETAEGFSTAYRMETAKVYAFDWVATTLFRTGHAVYLALTRASWRSVKRDDRPGFCRLS
jgi:hypothetical protein